MPCPVITVQTATGGPREVPTKWAGQWLAVHRPVRRDGLSSESCLWTVTLRPLGLSGGELAAPLRAVVTFARLWDTAAARWDDVTTAADASAWQWRDRFRDDVHRVRSGRPPIGPRQLTPAELIETAGTSRRGGRRRGRRDGRSSAHRPRGRRGLPRGRRAARRSRPGWTPSEVTDGPRCDGLVSGGPRPAPWAKFTPWPWILWRRRQTVGLLSQTTPHAWPRLLGLI